MPASSNIQESELTNQIQELKSQIKDLESSANPNSQTLLNSKKEELTKLEKQLNNQQAEQKDNSKLYLGIGGGVLGFGLISILIYLFIKNRKRE